MKMLRDMVCIAPEKEPKISDVILMTEDTGAKGRCYGAVLFTGPKCTFVKPGDHVWFEQFEHTVGPNDSIIIAEGEILARGARDKKTKGVDGFKGYING
jgi:hypothetical protein